MIWVNDLRKDQLVCRGPLPSCCPFPPADVVLTNTLVARFWAQGVHCLFYPSTLRTCCCIAQSSDRTINGARPPVSLCHQACHSENETKRPIQLCPKGLHPEIMSKRSASRGMEILGGLAAPTLEKIDWFLEVCYPLAAHSPNRLRIC